MSVSPGNRFRCRRVDRSGAGWPEGACPTSLGELKPLEAVQRFLDLAPAVRARLPAVPGPLLHQKLLPRAVGLEIEHRDDVAPDQHRLGKIAEQPFRLRHIGLEAMFIAKEEREALALDDERIERIEDMDEVLGRVG